jgi:hypothetical protein
MIARAVRLIEDAARGFVFFGMIIVAVGNIACIAFAIYVAACLALGLH